MTAGEAEALTAFAEARLAEDRERAEGLLFACKLPDKVPDFGSCGGPAAEVYWGHFGPRRMLDEVAAKRAIASTAAGLAANHDKPLSIVGEGMLMELVAIWSDHADYRTEWRPI